MVSSPPTSRATRVRWLIVLLLMGFTFLAHFNRVSISVAGTAYFIGPDRLTEAQMGYVYSAFLLIYTIGMLPGGWLIDRIGPRWAMSAMGLGLGLCAALTGMLGWLGLSTAALFVPLLVIRGLAGATSVPLHPGAARAVSLWMPLTERSTANGLVTAGALVGIALTYPLFGHLMDRVGWHLAFVICGVALMLYTLVWIVLSADTPAHHRWSSDAEQKLVAESVPAARSRAGWREVAGLFRNRSLVLLTLSYGALSYVQYMFFYWVEYYFKNVMNLPPDESRAGAFTVTMAMAFGMAGGGWVSDRLCRRLGQGWGSRAVAFLGMGLSALFSIAGVLTSDPRIVTAWFALALGALGLCEAIFWTMAPALEKRNGGLACALVNTGGNGVGMLAPILTPLLGNHLGWTPAVVVAGVICAVGALLWAGIKTPVPDVPVEPGKLKSH